jgi:predicted aldo/keto reductase-like oxidoreductase
MEFQRDLAKPIPPLSFPFDRYLAPDKIEDTDRKLKALNEIAKANNVSMAALATAWVLAYEDISCALAGFTKAAYIGENLSALALLENGHQSSRKRLRPFYRTLQSKMATQKPGSHSLPSVLIELL